MNGPPPDGFSGPSQDRSSEPAQEPPSQRREGGSAQPSQEPPSQPSEDAAAGPTPAAPPQPPPEALARVRRRLRGAAWLLAAGVVAGVVFTSLPVLDVLALPLLYLFLPMVAVAQLPLLDWEEWERMPVYLGSIVAILTLGLISGLLALRLEDVAPAGLTLLPAGAMVGWTVGLTLTGLLVILAFRPVEDCLGGGRPELLRQLLPETPRERTVFGGLSLSAGVGEELAYRGYAFQAVQLLGVGPWGAALLSSVPFGFLHSYQGPVGVVRTGAMGFVLAVPVVLTGSLLPSMAAHALIDLLVGLLLGPRLLSSSDPPDLVPPPSAP